MSLYLGLKDIGSEWLVTSVQTDMYKITPDTEILEITDTNLFSYLADLIAEKKVVKFSKFIEDLKIDNLVIGNESSSKESFVKELHKQIAKVFCLIPSYTYYRFAYLNNIFASKGIFITQENREDKYIEILEKNDEELMNYLEELLNVMNKLEYFETMYAKYLNACEELSKTSDELVMKQITDEAITFFKNTEKAYVTLSPNGHYSSTEGIRKPLINQ